MLEQFAWFAAFVPLFALVSLRVGVVFAALPAPFGTGSPVQVRVALTFLLALILALPHSDGAGAIALEPFGLGVAALGEVLVGAVIGVTVRVTLAAAEVAGNLAGLSMGQGFASTVDPTLGDETMPIGRALNLIAVLVFFAMSGHHTTLSAVAWSLTHAPVGEALQRSVHPQTLHIGVGLLAQGLRIASPVVGTMFIVQLGLGLIARSAPRVQVFSLSFAVMSAVGAVVVLAAAPAMLAAVVTTLSTLPDALYRALGGG